MGSDKLVAQARAVLWRGPTQLILASKSESRRALLIAAGIPVEAVPAHVDERDVEKRFLSDGNDQDTLAIALAEEKAQKVSRKHPDSICLGADQTLHIGDRILHKPSDRAEAEATLVALSGRRHCLISGFCLVKNGHTISRDVDRAFLTMRRFDQGTIGRYLDLAGPSVLSSVGAYRVEELGAHLFESIEGNHSTVLGLPMLKVLASLRGLGLLTL